jgi:hypothetical protein
MDFTKSSYTLGDILSNLGNAMYGGSNGGKYIVSAKGAISAAHVAAVGSGGTPGLTTFTVTQAGASAGTVSSTITAGGELPTIDTAVTVVTGGVKYSVADTLAVVGGSLTGGQIHITAIVMEEYDYIVVGPNVIFTELQDANGTDLLAAKDLAGITFGVATILKSGTAYKIRNMTYSGGNVFGYNF